MYPTRSKLELVSVISRNETLTYCPSNFYFILTKTSLIRYKPLNVLALARIECPNMVMDGSAFNKREISGFFFFLSRAENIESFSFFQQHCLATETQTIGGYRSDCDREALFLVCSRLLRDAPSNIPKKLVVEKNQRLFLCH